MKISFSGFINLFRSPKQETYNPYANRSLKNIQCQTQEEADKAFRLINDGQRYQLELGIKTGKRNIDFDSYLYKTSEKKIYRQKEHQYDQLNEGQKYQYELAVKNGNTRVPHFDPDLYEVAKKRMWGES